MCGIKVPQKTHTDPSDGELFVNQRFAVVTLAIGDFFRQMGEITHPLMAAYADRIGADFLILSEPKIAQQTGLPARYEKFQIFDLLEQYERIVFFDNDVLVSPLTPSLFDVVDSSTFAAVGEEGFSRAPLDKRLTQEVLGKVKWSRPYFNTGVMVCGSAHQFLFDASREGIHQWAAAARNAGYHPAGGDQPYLNHQVNSFSVPFTELAYAFNHTRVRTDAHHRFRSYCIHYAGPSGFRYGARLEQMKKDAGILSSPSRLRLAQQFPRIRWIQDRLDFAFLKYLIFERHRGKK